MKYSKSSKKAFARSQSVFGPYQEIFGNRRSKQVWSLCDDVNLASTSELGQILANGWSKRHYNGVNSNPKTIAEAKRIVPEAKWHAEDFYWALYKAKQEGKLDPALVFFDSTSMPAAGCEYFAKLMYMLSQFRGVVLVGNFIIKGYSRQFSGEDVIESLKKSPYYAEAMRFGWKFWKESIFPYPGKSRGRTFRMGTVVFYRR